MSSRWRNLAVLMAGLGMYPGSGANRVCAAELADRAGTIVGVVADPGGVVQMGATVMLFNRFERMVQKALTNEKGQFGFDGLLPDIYTIRVSLPSFVPAMRQGILVQPGMRSFLSINLASVLSSVEFVYASPNPPRMLADDWRWVLRSSMSTRPVLRFLPESNRHENVFSNTRGMVRLSAGNGTDTSLGSQPDLGTAFAVATSLYGVNQVEVLGNVGYSSYGGLPTASFRTRFSRESVSNGIANASSPEVQLTVRQTFVPGRTGALMNSGSAPSLNTMSAVVMDRTRLGDHTELIYGARMESISFIDRITMLSPFARAEIHAGKNNAIRIAWASGSAPDELYLTVPGASSENDLQQGLSSLSAFPRLSMRQGRTHLQRMEQAEAGYTRQLDASTQVSVTAFYENVANAALMAVGDTADYATSEMLPDLFTRSSIFNIGSYRRHGAMASVRREFGDDWSASASFGNGGTLQPIGTEIAAADPDALRASLRRTQRNWVHLRVTGTVPGMGTKFGASYMLTDYRAALPSHRYLTQRTSPDLGLNIQLRQPIPTPGLWNGRLEAVADLRNLLHQGYLPISTATGRRINLLPSPRTVRGGLAFIF